MSNDKRSFVPIREGETTIFYVNTGGFPLQDETCMKMYEFAKELQPQASDIIDDIARTTEFPEVPPVSPPYIFLNNPKFSNQEKLEKIMDYIDNLQYNHTGMQFFDIRKDRPLAGLMDVARKIIEESLPIKCLEATILSIYLTNEINTLERFPIGFKTVSNHNIHRHVVLGVYCHKTSQFGAIGISRRKDLGYKPLKFDTLSELIESFIDSYSTYLHKVKRVRIGMPIPNTNRSYESIKWNGLTVYPSNKNDDWIKSIEKHSRNIRIYNSYCTIAVENEIKQQNTKYEYHFKRQQQLQQQQQQFAAMCEQNSSFKVIRTDMLQTSFSINDKLINKLSATSEATITSSAKEKSLSTKSIKNTVLLAKRKISSVKV